MTARGCTARSGRAEDQLDGGRIPAPVRDLGLELPAAEGGEAVVSRAAVVLRDAPLVRHEAAVLEAQERRVDGALSHVERVVRHLLDALRDPPAVHGLE